jgi:7-cyano-7-deazaguanine synthase
VLAASRGATPPSCTRSTCARVFAWEAEELAAIERLLGGPPLAGRLAPLVQLTSPSRTSIPPSHWALRGQPPAFDTPDEDVYLTGRNIVLLSKAAIYCAQHGIGRIAIGPLAGNPVSRRHPGVLRSNGAALVPRARHIPSIAPVRRAGKADVIRLGAELGVPLDRTLSCMNPDDGRHCGPAASAASGATHSAPPASRIARTPSRRFVEHILTDPCADGTRHVCDGQGGLQTVEPPRQAARQVVRCSG